MPPNTVYVGRPSKWGNPFTVGKDGTAEDCVRKYRSSAFPPGDDEFHYVITEDNRAAAVRELRGKNLSCWCALDQPCHADVLLELANDQ